MLFQPTFQTVFSGAIYTQVVPWCSGYHCCRNATVPFRVILGLVFFLIVAVVVAVVIVDNDVVGLP